MSEICNRHVNNFLQIFNRNVSNMLQTCFRNFTDMLRTCYRHIRESNKLVCMYVKCPLSALLNLITAGTLLLRNLDKWNLETSFLYTYIIGQLKIFEPHLPSQNRYEIRTKYLRPEWKSIYMNWRLRYMFV